MPQRPTPRNTRFAAYSDPVIREAPNEDADPVQHLLWGDWLKLRGNRQGEWEEVSARGARGWMHEDDIQRDRLLEVVFVDVGQGDGALVVTPEDQHLIIDAGVDDSMYRYLHWRYGGFKQPWVFDAGIITHPDSDHYLGFDDLFTIPTVTFDVLYHSGIMERRGNKPLGPTPKKPSNGKRRYLTGLIRHEDELRTFLARRSNWEHPGGSQWNKKYPTMLEKGFSNGSFTRFRSLCHEDGHLPGWAPGEKSVALEILGPILERPSGAPDGALRKLPGSVGITKNGHSVVIRLVYDDVTILLGGDLNIPSQELLLEHHTGLHPRPANTDDYDALVAAGRGTFEVDVAKACHHGSADISTRFLAVTNPIATIISSGDAESHAHPRADALGAAGRYGRGSRPLVFSTELGRSWNNTIKRPEALKARLQELNRLIPVTTDGRTRNRLEREFNDIVEKIDRSVAVYGTVNVRTDGNRVVIAQKLEKPRGNGSKWDVYRLDRRGHGGDVQYRSKYEN